MAEETGGLLASLGLPAEPRWPWVHVGQSQRQQGWKIHLSCTPAQLPRLIAQVAQAWHRDGFVFKAIEGTEAASLLNEGGFGDTQIGKCVTVYPEDEERFASLVETFRRFEDVAGPLVPDDVWLGGIVFARYGGFNPLMRRDLLGQTKHMIADEGGTLISDGYDRELTHARFATHFAGKSVAAHTRLHRSVPEGVLNERYLIVDVLRASGKGALLQALDIRVKDAVRAVILKQGRAHVMSDRNGHDIRDRLRHQERMHVRAAAAGIAPDCDAYFEVDGDGYLPIEFQHNDNFEAWIQKLLVGQTIDDCSEPTRAKILAALDAVGVLLDQLHGLGIVHRDLSPSNVLMRRDERPLISDLEIAWEMDGDGPVYGKGTPGFMAPEQASGEAPRMANDVHAFAALVLYSVTGLDPRRLPRPERSDDWRALSTLGRSLSPELWSAIQAGLAADPAHRSGLSALRAALQRDPRRTKRPRKPDVVARSDIARLLAAGVHSIASPALIEPKTGIWLSAPVKAGSQSGARPEIRRGFNRGVAGPLYFCARYARHRPLHDDVRAACVNNARWLMTDHTAVDYAMPGLHFGETGVLLALYEARASGLLSFGHRDVDALWAAALQPAPTWPDFTHGAAGISVGLGRLVDLLASDGEGLPFDLVAERDRQLAHLLATQNADGSWTLPPGVDGLSGETVTGFAHGVAGIGYALAVAHAQGGGTGRLDAAVRTADWLLEAAQIGPEGSHSWPYSDKHADRWNWWCHGGPGISSLFSVLARITGRPLYRNAASGCLADVPNGFNPANLSLCHGASGLGELLLDAGRDLDRPELTRKAWEIATSIYARHARGARDVYWIVEDVDFVGADLMVGLSGVLHFLLRVVTDEPSLQFPALVHDHGEPARRS